MSYSTDHSRNLISIAFIIVIYSLVLFIPPLVFADDTRWKLYGETDAGRSLFYVDEQSVNASGGSVYFRAKKELSAEGLKVRRKAFDEQVARAEKESGGKVEDPDLWFSAIVKNEVKTEQYAIDCERNEIKRLPPKQSFIQMVYVDLIKKGSAEDKIKNDYCMKNPQKK